VTKSRVLASFPGLCGFLFPRPSAAILAERHESHPNHDRAFYGLLGTLMPDWQAMKQKLEQTRY